VAIRTCPICMAKVPAGLVVAYTDGMECPACHRPLTVSAGSRMLATTLGLLAATLVWRLTRFAGGMLDWLMPMLCSFLTFSVVAPLFLMLTADLRLAPAASVIAPEPAAAGHGEAGAHR